VTTPPFRSGFVAVAGRPNVGKSTLVNAICGDKVAIVSDKPQTTRRRIAGVANREGCQLVLVDLPGFQRPRDAMTERMQRTVDRGVADVDGVVFVMAADEQIARGDRFIAARVFAGDAPVVIALNKVDRLSPAEIARQIEAAATLGDFRSLHPVSARAGEGIDALADDLFEILPEGPVYFGEGETTDLPIEARVGELVREKALAATREEVPHAISVEVEELADGIVRANLYVETESQKGIVVGREGRMIKRIGTQARPEIEGVLGGPVFLDLRVKVRPKWRRDEQLLERLGI
jgi:GTP-binding protein Era